ncbi:hypothetical protein F4776DRAFT_461491 [Hypoxylon sp. NC0597]|nr:hypothetical protein F4776DRAFT_461491 [Hypoxylon sp. NC0597]
MGASVSSSNSTLVDSDNSAQSTANASASVSPSASPDPSASAPAPSNSATSTPTSSTPSPSSSPSQSPTLSTRADTSPTITFSGLGITQRMSTPSGSPNGTARTGVRFSDVTTVHSATGSTTHEPTNLPSSSSTGEEESLPQSAAAAPPPSGPPRGPPRGSTGSPPPPEPEPEEEPEIVAASTPSKKDNLPRVVSHLAPPIGASARAAMAQMNQPTYIILGGAPAPAPAQNMAFAGANPNQPNQPYLLVNPPLVAPSVPPPQPGNTGSWCKFIPLTINTQ